MFLKKYNVPKLTIERSIGRDALRRQFIMFFTNNLWSFIRNDGEQNSYILIFTEIIKNIFDHTDVDGYLNIEEDDKVMTITIGDYGNGKKEKTKTAYNFGVGLKGIKEVSEFHGLKVRRVLKKEKGFHYEIKFKRSQGNRLPKLDQHTLDTWWASAKAFAVLNNPKAS